MGNLLGGLKWTRVAVTNGAGSASFGGTRPSGARVVSMAVAGRCGCRILARLGSMSFVAGSSVIDMRETMSPSRRTNTVYFGDDGVIIQKRARVRISGGSAQAVFAWRNL